MPVLVFKTGIFVCIKLNSSDYLIQNIIMGDNSVAANADLF